jgi:hypothetical protein
MQQELHVRQHVWKACQVPVRGAAACAACAATLLGSLPNNGPLMASCSIKAESAPAFLLHTSC